MDFNTFWTLLLLKIAVSIAVLPSEGKTFSLSARINPDLVSTPLNIALVTLASSATMSATILSISMVMGRLNDWP